MDTVRAAGAEQNGPPLTRTIRAAEGEWKTIALRVHVKLLYKDGEARTYLLRIDPGGVVPGHPHDAEEECIVLEGEAFCGDFRVAAGDYHLAMRGSVHTGISSPGGALLFLRSTGAPHTSLV